jgi:hypothetical protein
MSIAFVCNNIKKHYKTAAEKHDYSLSCVSSSPSDAGWTPGASTSETPLELSHAKCWNGDNSTSISSSALVDRLSRETPSLHSTNLKHCLYHQAAAIGRMRVIFQAD